MRQFKPKSEKLIELDALTEAAECLRTIAHPHRLRMIQMLLQDEYTVGELADACGIPSHMASEHLGKMKDRGYLVGERRGRRIYYRVTAEGLSGILDCVREHFGNKTI
jgi:ArsR family transcriptional regulator, zinc-responsive transcriptional repressor